MNELKKMNIVAVKVILADGNFFTTRINLNFEGAKNYYLNRYFNMGTVDDDFQKCVDVELISVIQTSN